VGNFIQLLDPQTLQTCDIPSSIYWQAPFDSLASITDHAIVNHAIVASGGMERACQST